jgi:hypothetical protein
MDANLPAPREDAALVTDTGTGAAAGDHPAPPAAEQNLGVALLPLAVIALLVLAFVAAAWTFLASLPAA